MVVETTLGAGFCIAARPHAHVHGVDGRFASGSGGERMAGEQPPQSLGVDSSPVQRGVEAAPAATMRRFEAQVNGRRDRLRCEDGVGEFKEGIDPAVEAFVVERVAEGMKGVRGFHDAPIMPSSTPFRIPNLSAELKRKLSGKVQFARDLYGGLDGPG